MRIAPTQSMKQIERTTVLLFAMAQVALAVCVYFEIMKQAHLV
jgi:hypothetical protein